MMKANVQTVYVSIGNSDWKLSQEEWAEFYALTAELLTEVGITSAVHGAWHSMPASRYVNACWCVEVPDMHAEALKDALRVLARKFRQDSIAWAQVAGTEFLPPSVATA